jgi:MoxR-like ATPase
MNRDQIHNSIDTMDQKPLRIRIRTAIAAIAGCDSANNAAKTRVAQSLLGLSQGDATATGSKEELRLRLKMLLTHMSDSNIAWWERNLAAEVEDEAVVLPTAPTAPAAPAIGSGDPRAAALALLLQGGDEVRLSAIESKIEVIGKGMLAINDKIAGVDVKAAIAAAVQAVGNEVADIRATVSDSARMIADLCATAVSNPTVRARVASITTRSNSPVLARLKGLYQAGVNQSPIHAILLSPPGLGKSFWIRTLAAQYDVFVEHGCSNDSEEVNTLKGGATVRGDGSFLVYDGRITEAVRAAASGKNVLLFLDEVLRLSDRAQNVLLTFLTAVKKADGSMVYQWSTKQTDASGTSVEVIECPAERLHIIAAGNLNAAPIEAFWDRWDPIRIAYDETIVRHTAEAILAANGIISNELPKRFALAVTASRELAAQSQIKFSLSSRSIERAAVRAALMGVTDERTVGELCAERVPDSCAAWDARTGDIATASVGALMGIQKTLSFQA